MGEPDIEKPGETNGQMNSNTKSNSKQVVEKANERPEWLPDGWSVDVRIRKSGALMGSGYKCFIDPLKGYKFYSKPEVLRYLETIKDNGSPYTKKKMKDNSSPSTKEKIKDNNGTSTKEKIKDNSGTSTKEKRKGNSSTSTKEKIKDNSGTSTKEKIKDNNGTSTKEKIKDNNGTSTKEKIKDNDNTSTMEKIKDNDNTSTKEKIEDNSGTFTKVKIEDSGGTSTKEKIKDNDSTSTKEKIKDNDNTSTKEKIEDNSGTSTKVKIEDSSGTSTKEKINDNESTSSKERIKDNDNTSTEEKIEDNSGTSTKVKIEDNSGTSTKEKIKDNADTSTKKIKDKKCTAVHSPSNVVIEKSTADDLPPGWIKEVHIRKSRNGIRKDPFYIDPASGYVFRSKKDVWRYLESGDISKCAFKPSRRQIQDEDKSTPSPAAKRQKLKESAPKQQLFVGEEILDKSSLELQGAKSSREGQDVRVLSGMIIASVPVKMHTSEDEPAYPPGFERTFYLDDVQKKEHVMNTVENANDRNNSNSSLSKNKKESNEHHRFSQRLAGIEPVQLADDLIGEQTLQAPKRNSRKSGTTLDANMESKSSQQHLNGVPKIKHADKIQQEVITTSTNLSVDQSLCKEQPNRPLEADTVDDFKPEIHTNSNKSRNKKVHHIPRRGSKRLARFDHEMMSNSISCEKAPNDKSRKSKDEVNAELQQSQDGRATELADRVPINGESANKRRKSPQIPPITDNQSKKLEGAKMDDEKSECPMSFAFHYSWSDPSLESAINTLTGALPVKDSVDNGPTTVLETDIQKPLFDNVSGGSSDRNPQVGSNKSKNKKEPKVLPMRLSKRLAGLEPEVLPSDKPLEYGTRKSCKEEPLATPNLTDKVSDHLDAQEETKRSPHASDSLKTEVLGESSNKREKSYNAQTVPKELSLKVGAENNGDKNSEELLQKVGAENNGDKKSEELLQRVGTENNGDKKSEELLQKVGAENNGDKKSEPQIPLSFGDSWSDPCLDFAFKTLTGALPIDAVDVLPVMTPDINYPPYKELHGSVVTSVNEKSHDAPNQSQNKKLLNMVSQSSELFLGQPDLWTSSSLCANAPQFSTRDCHSDDGNVTRNLNGEPLHTEAGNVTQLVHHSGNTHTLIQDEPLRENGQVPVRESVAMEHPPLETQAINHDSFESQFCDSFMNSWSDPCLEFAFKTLTGEIPVDENFAIHGGFGEPANHHDQRNGGSMLPEFGSSSLFQSDNTLHYDSGVNTMPGQQSSMSSTFPPLEKASLQGSTGVDPQKCFSQCNKTFQR